ncbi:putative TetR family transcriptional regulator [Streptomyces sp. NBRC 110611]|uniref:TetR/AcrR family transcriptional regulator n=1 Tax=Streptomyces sp. NBRC 110611 TaxID=1621259 RepID=UPI000835C6F3|nr:TetR/AcrR family transcriptional regulator [Streptomyces sp. NBRC 110611]GAU69440.1 putative TetR family transcriptional regulator [Streptomyces sp. NBRC 110611]
MSRAAEGPEAAAAPSRQPGPVPGPVPVPAERRGRPRSAAADSAIIEAVLRLIEDGASIGELSMERIAREAGVGKATVYRRWPGKDALMLDVMRSLDAHGPHLEGASVRDDLVALLEFLRRRGLAKRNSALLRTVVSHVQAHPELWAEYHDTVVRARREAVLGILRRGVANGEIRADRDLETIADLFVGPMLARAVLHEWKELPEGLAEDIVDMVLEGVRPRPRAAAG